MFIKSLTHLVFLPLVPPFKWSSRNQEWFLLLTDTLYLANSNLSISPHQPLAMLCPLHFVFLQVGQFQILHISESCSFWPSRQPYLAGEHFHSNLIKKKSCRSLKAGMCPKSLSWIEEMTANYVVLAVDRVCMQIGIAYCNGDMYLYIYIYILHIHNIVLPLFHLPLCSIIIFAVQFNAIIFHFNPSCVIAAARISGFFG